MWQFIYLVVFSCSFHYSKSFLKMTFWFTFLHLVVTQCLAKKKKEKEKGRQRISAEWLPKLPEVLCGEHRSGRFHSFTLSSLRYQCDVYVFVKNNNLCKVPLFVNRQEICKRLIRTSEKTGRAQIRLDLHKFYLFEGCVQPLIPVWYLPSFKKL